MMQRLFLFLLLVAATACSQPANLSTNKTTMNETVESMEGLEMATLGAGCFWCVEAVFQDLKGVAKVESGYAGGSIPNPTYKQVCEGNTGHAEVARVIFDPKVISFEQLLEVFFQTHDPTTLNKQGGDIGTQYRSVIFYHDEAQKQTAEKMKTKAGEWWENPIVTEISPLPPYYPAEDYHQNYFNLNADKNPYCSAVIVPKVAKFKKQFSPLLKDEGKK